MRYLYVLGAVILLMPSVAKAAGILDVQSNVRGNIYLDGESIGSTPLLVRDIPGGNHELVIVDPASGKRQIFVFYVSKRVTVQKEVRAVFRPGDPAELIVEAGLNPVSGETGYRYSTKDHRYRASGPPHRHTHNREKVRIRNTALGLGTLGLLTGKDALTGIGFGGALVNELVNK
ncbi:MAG: PEGA domain-containing protein [Candidatus Wallbacteria bacterium]|nr:PEGA domain-containing protein [Candidatus Wallbacteria bacterium]